MEQARTAQWYGPGVTSASRSVLLEVLTILRSYQESLVLVGGWVPFLLLEQHKRAQDPFIHVGSIDIDLAVDPVQVKAPQYATIVELLTQHGYRMLADRRLALPSSFERTVTSPLTRKPYTIRIDFLTAFEASEKPRTLSIPVQDDLVARKIYGCEAAFRHQSKVEISGVLPEGGELSVHMRMADLIGCLAMKGIVLGERYREKDAYDIYALAAHYGEGPREVAAIMRKHLSEPLVAESMERIKSAFAKRESHGPVWVATFLVNPMFSKEYQRILTDAYMVVHEFVQLLREPQTSTAATA